MDTTSIYTLRFKDTTAQIRAMGAELCSLQNHQTEYMWQADASVWARHAPVLFPIVGRLRGDQFEWRGESYSLSQHGFARDMLFECVEQSESSVLLRLRETEESLKKFPFPFSLEIRYTLFDGMLAQQIRVSNPGESLLPFGFGAHPAFRLPLEEGLSPWDYSIRFEQSERVNRYFVVDGLLQKTTAPLLRDENILPLNPHLFDSDAVILKEHRSRVVTLASDKGKRYLVMWFHGFPHLGIWAKPGANFVCLEPWMSHHDTADASGYLAEKDGFRVLAPGELWKGEIRIFAR